MDLTSDINVEGFELNVLEGGANFFRDHSPLIFLEVHPLSLKEFRISVSTVLWFLSSFLGCKFYDGQRKEISNPLKFMSSAIRRIVCSKTPIS